MTDRLSSTDQPLTTGSVNPWPHILDIVFFRAIGVGILAWEITAHERADWHVLVAGFGAFFMPDWIRGKDSLAVQAGKAIARRIGSWGGS